MPLHASSALAMGRKGSSGAGQGRDLSPSPHPTAPQVANRAELGIVTTAVGVEQLQGQAGGQDQRKMWAGRGRLTT